MAGETITERPADLGQFIAARFPTAKKICSGVPEVQGSCAPADFATEAEPAGIDVTVVRAPLGVAETGSVLLSESEFVVNSVGLLAHDIVVLLDPKDIVQNIHDAYTHPYFRESGYCLLMSGPSGSGDISGVIVHSAQSSMTMTVIFAPRTR
jgi:L-lactate dehydrogenase complex protein LldG